MTSWIRARPVARPRTSDDDAVAQPRAYSFATQEGSFASQFNLFLYSYAYAQKGGRELQVYDRTNSVSTNYSLLRAALADCSGVVYLSDLSPTATALNGRRMAAEVLPAMSAIPPTSLRDIAKSLFTLNSTMEKKVYDILIASAIPRDIDVGVHLRPGTRDISLATQPIPVGAYLTALRSYQAKAKLPKMKIFLISDSETMTAELKKQADASWTFVSLPSKIPLPSGYSPAELSRLRPPMRETAYIQFLTEVGICQNLPAFIGSLSSDVDRFIYLTADTVENFRSLDLPKFTAF